VDGDGSVDGDGAIDVVVDAAVQVSSVRELESTSERRLAWPGL